MDDNPRAALKRRLEPARGVRILDDVLDPEGLEEAAQLYAEIASGRTARRELELLGRLHRVRAAAISHLYGQVSRFREEVRLSWVLSARVFAMEPDAVEEAVRDDFESVEAWWTTGPDGTEADTATFFEELGHEAAEIGRSSTDPRFRLYTLALLRVTDRLLPEGDSRRPQLLVNLGSDGVGLAFDTQNQSLLEQAIGDCRTALCCLPPREQEARVGTLSNLGQGLILRHQLAENSLDLAEGLCCLWRALVSPTRFEHSERLLHFVSDLLNQLVSPDITSADVKAAAGHTRAGWRKQAGNESVAAVVDALAESAWQLWKAHKDPDQLDEAVLLSRDAASATAPGHPELVNRLDRLAQLLADVYRSKKDDESYQQALAATRRATEVPSATAADRTVVLGNLAQLQYDRYSHTHDVDHFTELVTDAQRAIDTALDDFQRAERLSWLGVAYWEHYQGHADEAVLLEGIALQQQALALLTGETAAERRRPTHLLRLSALLRARAERTGEADDLDAAVQTARQAADTAGKDSLGAALANLAAAYGTRYEMRGDRRDDQEALAAGQRAVLMAPSGHRDHALHLSNLALMLLARHRREPSELMLAQSVSSAREALRATDPNDPDLPRRLNCLLLALSSLAETPSAGQAVRDELTVVATELAAVTDASYVWRTAFLLNAGAVLWTAYMDGNDSQRQKALDLFEEAADNVAAPPAWRLSAEQYLAHCALWEEDVQRALDHYARAVDLLPLVASRRLRRTDAEHWLQEFAGIARDAAACAVAVGEPERAVGLLELGRGILLGQALDARTDLKALRDRSPQSADRFLELCELLAVDEDPADPAEFGTPVPGASGQQRHQCGRELEALLAHIRTRLGLPDFLLPPDMEKLRADATSHGPVVLINTSWLGCTALILTRERISAVDLPLLSDEDAHQAASDFVQHMDTIHRHGSTAVQRKAAGKAVRKILDAMWHAVAKPVLDSLRLTHTPGPEDTWPRLWWIPTGPLALLPLHATGPEDRSEPAVIDRLVSSYAPTVRALAEARRRGKHDRQPGRGLVVVMERTPEQDGSALPELPGTAAEAGSLAGRFLAGANILRDEQATRSAVLALLPDTTWVHFACHGRSDPLSPSRSLLFLHDHATHPLTSLHFSHLGVRHGELACLSACSTARTSVELADEAIQIASALHLAGYRQVIGTLWPVDDVVAAQITHRVYEQLTPGAPAPDAAVALHHAVRWIREHDPMTPSLWAAHVHVGT